MGGETPSSCAVLGATLTMLALARVAAGLACSEPDGLVVTAPDSCLHDGGTTRSGDAAEIYCWDNEYRFCLSHEDCDWRDGVNNTVDTCSDAGLRSYYMIQFLCSQYEQYTEGEAYVYCVNGKALFGSVSDAPTPVPSTLPSPAPTQLSTIRPTGQWLQGAWDLISDVFENHDKAFRKARDLRNLNATVYTGTFEDAKAIGKLLKKSYVDKRVATSAALADHLEDDDAAHSRFLRPSTHVTSSAFDEQGKLLARLRKFLNKGMELSEELVNPLLYSMYYDVLANLNRLD